MILRACLLLLLPQLALAWGSGSGSTEYTNFGDSVSRDWLEDGSTISIQLDGCVWGYVYDSEEAGCLEDSSEDGTTNWYMMSNCRRAQAAFSLYSSSSSGSCSSSTFQESFVTTVGLAEFVGWLAEWDSASPFGENGGDDGDNGWNVDELPLCEAGNNGKYIGLGCNSDGSFSINYFEDEYCLKSTGVYNTLDSINYQLKTYQNCQGLDSVGGGGGGGGGDDENGEDHDGDEYGLAQTLVYYANSCSNLDSAICTDDATMQSRSSSAGTASRRRNSSSSKAHKSWSTKVKYVMGGFLLLASLIMFTGILFTNRRRRKALMQRKFRQSSRRDKSRSRRSQSKSRSERSRGSSRRSKSRSRAAAESSSKHQQDDNGVMT